MINQIVVGAIATNCWIVPLDETIPGADASASAISGCAVIDPGADASASAISGCAVIDPGADAGVIIARLERLNLYPRYILLTHGHFDHIAALPELARAFAGAPAPVIAIHREDAAYLGREAYRAHRACFDFLHCDESLFIPGAAAGELWKTMPEPGLLLEEGVSIGPFRTLHLPGHSPGSAGFYDAERGLLFSGDTLFRGDTGRTDLPGGDWDTLRKSLDRLFTLEDAVTVYPGHGPVTTIGAERGSYFM
jgi:glyoxylase-like metal-dependent hydrolase (beta-lactamase superfamily II)